MAEQTHQIRLTDAAYGPSGSQGLAAAAHEAAGAGRGGDSFLVHVNGKELAEMQARWGQPTINPHTGMPEFFLGGLRDWFKQNPIAQVALPVATSMLLPGLGSSVGSAVNDGLGLGLESTGSAALGGALVNGGLGALTGGTRGALIGGAVGAAIPWMQGGGLGNGIAGMMGGGSDGGFNNDAAKASMGLSSPSTGSSGGALSNLFGGGSDSGGALGGIGKALPLIAIAGMMGGGGGKTQSAEPAMTTDQQAQVASQQRHLPQVNFNRQFVAPKGDLTKYGYGSEQTMFRNDQLPTVPLAGGGSVGPYNDGPDRRDGYYVAPPVLPLTIKQRDQALRSKMLGKPDMPAMGTMVRPANEYAHGGEPQGALAMASQAPERYVTGPGDGRADKIPAKLSNGEYVMDAETTALLGNGSSDAGGKVLDQFREAVRKHKGKALAKGKFSPNAKDPMKYLPKGAV